MPSLLAIHAGRRPESASLTELRAGGIISTTRLDPLVHALVSVITNPSLVVTVEIDGPDPADRPRLATIWRNGDTAVGGSRDQGGRFELIQIDPLLLPFHLAQVVQLVPRAQPRYTGTFRVPIGTLTLVESFAATDPSRAERELAAVGVAAPWIDRILATLIMRRSLWAIESIWLGDHRRREEARLSVLDGGFAGYWRLNRRDGHLTVTPTDFEDLMRRFAALLPEF
jgi:hypothetical protein